MSAEDKDTLKRLKDCEKKASRLSAIVESHGNFLVRLGDKLFGMLGSPVMIAVLLLFVLFWAIFITILR